MATPFQPSKLPIENLDWSKLIRAVGEANAALARYDGLLHGIVNPEVLLSPLTLNEAVLSSRIEGTNATNSEVLEFGAGSEFDLEKTHDIQEIENYRMTLNEEKRLEAEFCFMALRVVERLY